MYLSKRWNICLKNIAEWTYKIEKYVNTQKISVNTPVKYLKNILKYSTVPSPIAFQFINLIVRTFDDYSIYQLTSCLQKSCSIMWCTWQRINREATTFFKNLLFTLKNVKHSPDTSSRCDEIMLFFDFWTVYRINSYTKGNFSTIFWQMKIIKITSCRQPHLEMNITLLYIFFATCPTVCILQVYH